MAKMHCQGIEEFNWRLVRNHLTTPRVGDKRQMGRLLFTPGGEIWWVFVWKGKDWIMKQAWSQKTLQLLYYWYMYTQSNYLDGYHRNINEKWNNHETTICSLLLSWLIQDGSQMDSKRLKRWLHGNSCPSLREPFCCSNNREALPLKSGCSFGYTWKLLLLLNLHNQIPMSWFHLQKTQVPVVESNQLHQNSTKT